jgi:hypothetical protein
VELVSIYSRTFWHKKLFVFENSPKNNIAIFFILFLHPEKSCIPFSWLGNVVMEMRMDFFVGIL